MVGNMKILSALLWIFVLRFSKIYCEIECLLPASWNGTWFLSGYPEPIYINETFISKYGTCVQQSGDRYLFKYVNEDHSACYKGLLIFSVHENVLQYRESEFCELEKDFEATFSQFGFSPHLFSLFRINHEPTQCPFQNLPLSFTYTKNDKRCEYPVSSVDSCTDYSRMIFTYEACPEVPKSESLVEEMQCIASWMDGNHYYLVALVRDNRYHESFGNNYRCIMYGEVKETLPAHIHRIREPKTVGYKLALSAFSDCHGLSDLSMGEKLLNLFKENSNNTTTKLPDWIVTNSWETFDRRKKFKFFSRLDHTLVSTVEMSTDVSFIDDNDFFKVGSEIHLDQLGQQAEDNNTFSFIGRLKYECKSEPVCFTVVKRSDSVIELYYKRQFTGGSLNADYYSDEESPCGTSIENIPFITLVNPYASLQDCPFTGKYSSVINFVRNEHMLNQLCVDDTGSTELAHTMSFGCTDSKLLELQFECQNIVSALKMQCVAHWESENSQYLVLGVSGENNELDTENFFEEEFFCLLYQNNGTVNEWVVNRHGCMNDGSSHLNSSWTISIFDKADCPVSEESSPSSNFSPELYALESGGSLVTYYIRYIIFVTLVINFL